MNISLDPELEKLVNAKVQSGQYRSTDEVLNDAVRLLRKRDEAEARLDELLQEGLRSEASEMTREDWEDIRREGLAQFKARHPD